MRRLVHVGCRKSSLALLARAAELEEQTANGGAGNAGRAAAEAKAEAELPIQSQHDPCQELAELEEV